MKKLCFVFPGQGSQVPGMGKDFAEDARVRELFERADDALRFNLTRLMWSDDAATLTLTENAQPALLVCGLAALAYLKAQTGQTLAGLATCVAGHSLGEYTAVAAAGGMAFETAVNLVRLRGEAMRDCGQAGSMSAILGLEPDVVESVAAAHGVVFANDNAPGQAILSGPTDALALAELAAKDAGAKRALRLNVSGPFHTPAMTGAAGEVRAFLQSHPLNDLDVPCIMNVSAAIQQASADVAAGLVAQITGRVRWRESMLRVAEHDVEHIVELGVGKVLAGMANRCDARLSGVSLQTRADVEAFAETRHMAQA